MDQLRVETYRETIGGVEVVDAAYADRLLNAAAKVMLRHGEWRAAIEACRTEDTKTNRNRANSARGNYRRARYECGVVIDEARVKLE